MADERTPPLDFHVLVPDRWDDFERLFGARGACGGCWCMWWRITRREFEENRNAGNRRAFKALVEAGEAPGILAYTRGEAVGWCAVAPRDHYGSLERSRVLKRLDERPVWSLVCLFVSRQWRGAGIAHALVEAAASHAAASGAELIEAYPTAPRGRRLPVVSTFMGFPDLFAASGFEVCARPSPARVIMRRTIKRQLTDDPADPGR